jgi:hypothetical protein
LFQNNDGSQKISGDSLKNVYKSFVSEYPIVSIEDPFDQDDWVHYAKMTEEIREQVQIVGDDLLVTNPTVSVLFHFAWRKETSFIALSIIYTFMLSFSEGFKGYQGEVMQCSSAQGFYHFQDILSNTHLSASSLTQIIMIVIFFLG